MDYDNFIAMRKIKYTPDYVHIDCNIGIRWLQDVFFESLINAPKILKKDQIFTSCIKTNSEIIIPIQQWVEFSKKIISSFRNDNFQRNIIISKMNETLIKAKGIVNQSYRETFFDGKVPTIHEINQLINLLVELDSYAIFNMFLPRKYYTQKLSNINISEESNNIDSLMICFIEPHRIQVRKEKIKLALNFNNLSKEEQETALLKYQFEYGVYEEFENWIYDVNKFKNYRFLEREIKSLIKTNDKNVLEEEYKKININRKNQIFKFFNLINEIYKKEKESKRESTLNCFLYLALITTEEEFRHMLESKIFAVIGLVFSKYKIEATRYNLNELKDILNLIINE